MASGLESATRFAETKLHALGAAFTAAIQLFLALDFLVSHGFLILQKWRGIEGAGRSCLRDRSRIAYK